MKVRRSAAVLAIISACILVELVLTLADIGVLETFRLRRTAYEYGGFWPGLLQDWTPNYRVQPLAMFLTYSFLHTGFVHLLVNMITLYSLGGAVVEQVGNRGFLWIFAISTFGGAAGYAALGSTTLPMVGASGALFGLAGALVMWSGIQEISDGRLPYRTSRAIGLLALLNLALWWAMDGHLAWETHLGGFLAGAVAGLWFDLARADAA